MKRLASIIATVLAAGAAFPETPAYYVEWIQTSGTQFINTGVNGKAGIQAEVDFQFAAMANSVVVLGSSAGSDATAFEPFRLAPSKQHPSYRYGAANVSYAGTTALKAGTRMVLRSSFKAGEQLITRDGAPYGTAGTSATDLADNGRPMFLGASNKNGARDAASSIRVFSLKIWDASSVTATNLVRDFRPCVDANGAIGMHDLVSGDIFLNAGSGAFTCGARWNDDTQAYDLWRVALAAGNGGTVSAAPADEFLQAGTALTVTATPDAGSAFTKWAGTLSGSKYSAVQSWAALSQNITLAASFSADVGAPIRRYAAPTAAGTKDGTSWENAAALEAAYEDVGVNPRGGEVWLKEGAYLLNADPGIELLPNVRLIGGFAGDETDASQSAPAAHETLLHGANKTYYWCTNSMGNSTGVAIVENGRVNMPPIERCAPEAFFYSNGNYSYNYGFFKSAGCATNSAIENITFAHFGRYAVSVTTPLADGFTLSNCRFIANGYAQGNNKPAVVIANSHSVVDGCDFVGNRHAIRFESSSRTTTNVIARTTFRYNRHGDYSLNALSACIGSYGKACLVVDSCLFERNAAALSNYGPATCIKVDSDVATTLAVSNTVFRGNQGRLSSSGCVQLQIKGGVATFDDCIFEGNTNVVSGGHGYAACVGVNDSLDVIFRDTYFGRNFLDAGTSVGSCGSVFSTGSDFNCDTIFINCTAEGNFARNKGAGTGTIGEYRCSNYIVVNSVFAENDAFCGTDRQPEIIRTTSWNVNNRLIVVNSVFTHSAADYLPFAFNSLYFLANSHLKGLDLSSASTSGTGFVGDILTGLAADPGLRAGYAASDGGAPARGLAKDSPLRKKARGIWLGSDGRPYCQDNSGRWRRLRNVGNGSTALPVLSAEDAAALGLDAASAVIPDATGRTRFHKPSPGPLDFADDATRFFAR